MNDQIKTLFDEARKLSPAQREELARMLLGTRPSNPAIDAAWSREAQTRWDEFGESGVPAGDAFAAVDDARRRIAVATSRRRPEVSKT